MPIPEHWDWYLDTDSGFRFEISTRDLAHNFTRMMVYSGRELACECTFLNRFHVREDKTRRATVTFDERQMARTLNKRRVTTFSKAEIIVPSEGDMRRILTEAISAIFTLNRFVTTEADLIVDFRDINMAGKS